MKRITQALLVVALLAFGSAGRVLAVNTTGNANISKPQTDIATWKHKGSSHTALALSNTGQLNMPEGLIARHEVIGNLQTISVYQSSAGVFEFNSTTTTLVAGATTFTNRGHFRQPLFAQVLALHVALDTAAFTYVIGQVSTVTLAGYNARSEVIRETLLVSTTLVFTSNAFLVVSSVTFSSFTVTSVSSETPNVFLRIGSTYTYGLALDVETSRDISRVSLFNSDWNSYTLNTQYDTIRVSSAATLTGDRFHIYGRDTRSPTPRRR